MEEVLCVFAALLFLIALPFVYITVRSCYRAWYPMVYLFFRMIYVLSKTVLQLTVRNVTVKIARLCGKPPPGRVMRRPIVRNE